MSGYPSRFEAQAELDRADRLNPGPWTAHSRYAAQAAEAIAAACGLDGEKAYVLGLLHDIGRREGVSATRHVLAGYRYCLARGWPEAARVCLTHSYLLGDVHADVQRWDLDAAEGRELETLVGAARYDDYDRLIQLCDALALPTGCCVMEKRLVDVAMRYGLTPSTLPRWRQLFAIKADFEARMGRSVYQVLPRVVENTLELEEEP